MRRKTKAYATKTPLAYAPNRDLQSILVHRISVLHNLCKTCAILLPCFGLRWHTPLILNHGPTVLVSSACNGVANIMAAACSMPLAVISLQRLTFFISNATFNTPKVKAIFVPAGLAAVSRQCP